MRCDHLADQCEDEADQERDQSIVEGDPTKGQVHNRRRCSREHAAQHVNLSVHLPDTIPQVQGLIGGHTERHVSETKRHVGCSKPISHVVGSYT